MRLARTCMVHVLVLCMLKHSIYSRPAIILIHILLGNDLAGKIRIAFPVATVRRSATSSRAVQFLSPVSKSR